MMFTTRFFRKEFDIERRVLVKNTIYILMFVIIFFMLFDLWITFTRGKNFEVEYYVSEIEVDYSTETTITTTTGLVFRKERDKQDYLSKYLETSKNTFDKYFEQISKDIGKDVRVIDFRNSYKERQGVLELTEQITLSNICSDDGQGVFTLDMGRLKLNTAYNSVLKVYLPKDSVLITVEPTATKITGNTIVWEKDDIIYFPRITFERKVVDK